MSDGFRCSTAGNLRGEPEAGTASTVGSFLLVENDGPWGVDALRDSRLPDGLGEQLAKAGAAARVRVLLIRRFGRQHHKPPGVHVYAAHVHPERPWAEAACLDDVREILDVDLTRLGAGESIGLAPHDEPLYCVCTHGRHDMCCAERGRPVAAALAATHVPGLWETSHIGGDRFAGNMLVLPHGLYYGRLTSDSARVVVRAHAEGDLDLDHLRGRSCYPMPVQAAEIALRRELGETRLDAVRVVERSATDGRTVVGFRTGGGDWRVVVQDRVSADRHLLTCHARAENPVPIHEIVEIVEVVERGPAAQH